MSLLDVLIVGPKGNTHVAGSLERAAAQLGLTCRVEDTAPAYQGPRLLRALLWRLCGRRPYGLNRFSAAVEVMLTETPPRNLITIGQAPVTEHVLRAARGCGIRSMTWCTDDPWNSAQLAPWHLSALPHYDVIFTPRRSNIVDFRALGCRDVRYLPFGYDHLLFDGQAPAGPGESGVDGPEVLFVGGADDDRLRFFRLFMQSGLAPTLVGGYWDRYPETRRLSLGLKNAAELSRLTAQAAVNICLVRRANRDGHVMRSFEIPAVGGFMLAEDTVEHRDLFGPEGVGALYFNSPQQAAQKACWIIDHPAERRRMASALHTVVRNGHHTYEDRLRGLLATT